MFRANASHLMLHWYITLGTLPDARFRTLSALAQAPEWQKYAVPESDCV